MFGILWFYERLHSDNAFWNTIILTFDVFSSSNFSNCFITKWTFHNIIMYKNIIMCHHPSPIPLCKGKYSKVLHGFFQLRTKHQIYFNLFLCNAWSNFYSKFSYFLCKDINCKLDEGTGFLRALWGCEVEICS